MYYNRAGSGYWGTFIDKIEGLRTMDEVTALEAQQAQEYKAAQQK